MARPTPARLRFEPLEDRLTPAAVPLDPTFGDAGVATVHLNAGTDYVNSWGQLRKAAAAPDGGVYALTSVSEGATTRFELLRLTAAGVPDPAFAGSGRAVLAEFTYDGVTFDFVDLAVQPDGKVVVLGSRTPAYDYYGADNYQSDLIVRRYNPDGSADAAFGDGGTAVVGFDAAFPAGSYDTAIGLAVAADGRIVVAGRAAARTQYPPGTVYIAADAPIYSYNDDALIGVARLTPDGRLDPTFDSDGRALFGDEAGFAERFPPDAPAAGRLRTTAHDVAVTPDGGVVVVGSVAESYPYIYAAEVRISPPYYFPPETFAFAARLTPDGRLDPAFDGDGVLNFDLPVPAADPTDRVDYSDSTNQEGRWVAARPDGQLVVGVIDRTTPVTRLAVYRLGADGRPDAGYGTAGVATLSDGWGFADVGVAADGRVFAVTGTDTNRGPGAVAAFTGYVSVLTPDGQLDRRYGDDGRQRLPVGTAEDAVTPVGLLVTADGGVTVAANAAADPSDPRAVVVRFGPPPTAPAVHVTGAGGEVRVYRAGPGRALTPVGPTYAPFDGYTGVVRMATADFNGDGYLDTVCARGDGVTSVRVTFGVRPGAEPLALTLALAFDAYEDAFRGGLFVAAGDIDGDGRAELVTSPNLGGAARVQVFGYADGALVLRDNFFTIEDPAYRGGGRVALGDLNGDGKLDLIVGAGAGGSSRTAVYDGAGLLRGAGAPPKLVGDFLAIPDSANLRDGVYVSAGDLNGDGRAELVVGSGDGGGPRVCVLDAARLLASADAGASLVSTFFAGDAATRAGCRVSVRDADGDGRADLLAASGGGTGTAVRVYHGASLTAGGDPPASGTLDLTGYAPAGGVFVD